MGLFNKKKVEFIPAICPKCNCNLEADSNFEVAYCPACGLRCIINENLGKKQKQSNFDKMISFVERQQNIKREEKKLKQEKLEKQEEENKLFWKKYWWMFLLGFVLLFVFVMIMSILEGKGVV